MRPRSLEFANTRMRRILAGDSQIRLSQEVSGSQITMEHLRKAKRVQFVIVVAGSLLLGARGVAKALHAPRAAQAVSAGRSPSFLDFETYRNRIEPIFLKTREGGVRCYDCHSLLATRLRLQPLAPGSSSWTEKQSLRNFEAAVQLVTPSDPLKSSLLLHPLAQGAGGDATHTGGKFWASQNDPEWKTIAEWVRHSNSTGGRSTAPAASHSITAGGLDFEFFKSRVQPVFLKERPGHARCYGCHMLPNRTFHLEPLPPEGADWTLDQSQRNFQSALQQVGPRDPPSSRIVIHPLAPAAGGGR